MELQTIDLVRIAAAGVIGLMAAWFAGRRAVVLVRLLGVAKPMPDRMGNWGTKLKYQLTHVVGQQKILQLDDQRDPARADLLGLRHPADPDDRGHRRGLRLRLPHSLLRSPAPCSPTSSASCRTCSRSPSSSRSPGFAFIRFAQNPRSAWAASEPLLRLQHAAGLVRPARPRSACSTRSSILRGVRYAEGTLPYEQGAFLSRGGRPAVRRAWTRVRSRSSPTAFLVAHIATLAGFVVFVLHSKHLHVLTIPFAVAFSRLPKALGGLETQHIDLEEMDEETVLGRRQGRGLRLQALPRHVHLHGVRALSVAVPGMEHRQATVAEAV